jgi:hypothetical protein
MSAKSQKEFLAFLDWLGTKGILPGNTAHARKAVANKVLATLEPSELEDVTLLDVDEVMRRFTNKHGKNYTPESLRSYHSRFRSSITDFIAYCDNPVGFRLPGRARPGGKDQADGEQKNGKVKLTRPKIRVRPPPSINAEPARSAPASTSVVPIQVRANLIISVGPIPHDFSASEARRVANVIMALAVVD